MKKHAFEFDLKSAFPPMPEDCKSSLMHAVRSVKEEEPVKKNALRTGLVIALILLLTMGAALAASQLGLIDLINQSTNTALPESAQNILNESLQKTYEVGPITLTLQETLADGHLLYANTLAHSKTPAVLTSDPSMRIDPHLAKALNVDEKLSYQEAAQTAKVPMYQVIAWLETDWDFRIGEEMMDEIYNDQGDMLLIDLIETDSALVPPVIHGTLSALVYELDPATGERIEGKKWQMEDPIEIPVQGTMAKKEYQVEKGSMMDGFTLESVQAEQTCAGVYFTLIWQAEGELDQNRLHAFYNALSLQNTQGDRLPEGVNFSGMLNSDQWPTFIYGNMLGIDHLPDTLVIHNAKTNEKIILK